MDAESAPGAQEKWQDATTVRRDSADKPNMRYPRACVVALAQVLLALLGGCSQARNGPVGRVSTADLHSGKLPVAEQCVTGVATYFDHIAETLVVTGPSGLTT